MGKIDFFKSEFPGCVNAGLLWAPFPFSFVSCNSREKLCIAETSVEMMNCLLCICTLSVQL